MNGVILIHKEKEFTSFDVVAVVRKLIGQKKVGHTGTLDPLATGVVVVCTGKKTKQIDVLQAHTKEYVATLQLGATTPSYDLEKPIDQNYPTDHITRELIDEVLPRLQGEIWQIPPTFSAVKIAGKRAYEYARKGQQVEIKPKLLVIDELEVVSFSPESMQLTIRVVCSKGTYIRALARDIGEALHSGAHLIALRRTRVGTTTLNDCMTIEQFIHLLDNIPSSDATPMTN